MPSINNYDFYIFDCDGVIFDSNQLKIDAMAMALKDLGIGKPEAKSCTNYFAKNFGKSRFHHVRIFLEKYISIPNEETDNFAESLLSNYSQQCQRLYLTASFSPGFIEFISNLNGPKFVASGSEQAELRHVFLERNIAQHFKEIYGSPTPKTELVSSIIKSMTSRNAIMIGDALSDLQAAQANNIDFMAYSPYSNVPEALLKQTHAAGFLSTDSWQALKENS